MKFLSISFLLLLVFSAVASFFIDYNPYSINLPQSLLPPSWSHPFGMDENGQGLFLQSIYAIRISLIVTISVVSLSFVIGLIIGTLAGYIEGWIEIIFMNIIDLVLAFPKFLIALALVAMLGASTFNIIFALTFSTWAGFARLIRAEVKHLKQKEFVLHSKGLGASSSFLIYKHIWPSLMGIGFVHGLFQVCAVLIAESGLSFLGLGVSLEKPSLGALLGMGRQYIFSAPHITFFPGLILFLLLFSLNYIGESFRESLSPQDSTKN